MSVFTVEVEGFDAVKNIFKEIERELSAAQTRQILDEAGKVVVDVARNEVPYKGQIQQFFKRDLGVYRDHTSAAKNAEYVLIGPRFKSYTINGRDQKVAVIAQHMTQGFTQTERVTKAGERRGHVATQEINPVLDAFQKTGAQRNAAIEKGIEKQINKIKSHHPELLK